MTQISRDDVLHLAALSSLKLTDEEVDLFTIDIERILEYVRLLDELNTDMVEPTYQVTDLENIYRADKLQPLDVTRKELLALAPLQQDNQIKVQKVL